MSSTSSRFPGLAVACKFPQITMKFSLPHHQVRAGRGSEHTLVDELPHQALPIIDY